MTGRIIGLTLCHDEWPLVAASVDHALAHHVDELWVFDHASEDDTSAGLLTLARQWPDRLHVRRLPPVFFHQDALQSLAVSLAGVRDGDWVYFIDADEFPLAPTGGLRDVLAALKDDVDVMRYEMHNFVAHRSTQSFAANDLATIDSWVAPVAFCELPGDLAAEQVELGVNLFDYPVTSKVIYRHRAARFPWTGSHGVVDPRGTHEVTVTPECFYVAHLPLADRSRLTRRAAQGRAIMSGGFPPGYGWQLRVAALVDAHGGLDELWRRHTVASPPEPTLRVSTDPALAQQTAATRARLAGSAVDHSLRAPEVTIDDFLRLIVAQYTMLAEVIATNDALFDEHASTVSTLHNELANTRAELAAVYASRTWTWGQRVAGWLPRRRR